MYLFNRIIDAWSVAEDVDVVAGVEVEHGEPVCVGNGAPFGGAEEPFDDVEVARVGGDGDEQSAAAVGCRLADDGLGVEGAAGDALHLAGDADVAEELLHKPHVVLPFGTEAFNAS